MAKIQSILKNVVFPALKNFKPVHYLVFATVIALGIFNAVTGIMPQVKQDRYEKGIEKSFAKWWNDERADQFKAIGLEPNEKIRSEEFEQFRDRALAQKPSYIIEDRIKTIKKDFREWWEIKGGKEAFTDEYKHYPNEADFQRELEKRIDDYTDKFARYSMAFVPKRCDYGRLLTSWMLFPSIWSYLIFAVFFIFAIIHLERRWQWFILWGIIGGLVLLGGILISALTSTSFFDHYDHERYMGMSLVLVFLLGATTFAPRKELVTQATSIICVAGLLLDMGANWFANSGIFGAVTIASPLCFGLGALAGAKIETRRKTKLELKNDALQERTRRIASRNPMAEMRTKNRAMIEAGFASAKNGQLDLAQRQLAQAMTQLLQEQPVDTATIKSLAERMASPTLYIEISSNQWLEWGELAKTKNVTEAAIMLLKKGLSLERDRNFARRALFALGEICVNSKVETDNGFNCLRKVIEMNATDMLAKQATRLLEANGQPLVTKPHLQDN